MRAQDHAISSVKAKLQVRRLNFYYGRTQALKNIELSIPERKITAFIGPSGCGKSTLLRTFNKMYTLYPEQRAEGEIWMDGEKPARPQTGYCLVAGADWDGFSEANPVSDVGVRQYRVWHEIVERLSGAEMD